MDLIVWHCELISTVVSVDPLWTLCGHSVTLCGPSVCTSFTSGESGELGGQTSGGRGCSELVWCRVSLDFDKLQHPPPPSV